MARTTVGLRRQLPPAPVSWSVCVHVCECPVLTARPPHSQRLQLGHR